VSDHETPFLFTPSVAFAAPGGGLDEFLAQMGQAHVIVAPPDDGAAVEAALRQIPRVGKAESSADGLPIVEVPPSPGAPTGNHPLVIFYSGDGGWRDIDKKIGGYLADHGYFVVGVDALRYFWRKKEPHEMAADLDRLIRHYRSKTHDDGVLLVGYSFGADLLPFMINRMAPDTRAQIRLVSLLGIAEHASFEIRLQGILGASNSDGPATLPELERLKNLPVQCVFGFDEHDSVCAAKELDGIVDRDELHGGHHFDGDYSHIADLIVAADRSRANSSRTDAK
jgi:type IV secretory pathway VirJ component